MKEEFYLEEVESRCFKNKTGWLPCQPNRTILFHKTPSINNTSSHKEKIVSVQPVFSVLGN